MEDMNYDQCKSTTAINELLSSKKGYLILLATIQVMFVLLIHNI